MAYPHLNGNEKISESYTRINDNFDAVDTAANTHKTAATLDHPDGSVTAAKLAAGSVTTPKLADGSVTAAKVAADVATQAELDAHAGNAEVHTSVAEHTKLAGIAAGAQVNQPAFSTVNDVEADDPEDGLTIAGGTGITISSNPATKTLTVTATGTATPGAHASSHITGGADVIPDAVAGGASGLMSGADKTKVDGAIQSTQKGVAGGLASLDTSGHLPTAQLPPTTWLYPTLLNNWINYGGTEDVAAYGKDALGYVHIRGLVKLGVSAAVVFILPAGFRPSKVLRISISGAGKFGEMSVMPNGEIYFNSAIDGTYVSMIVPPFLAEQ